MECKICGSASERVFSKKLLQKYDVDYFRCPHCGFLQTQEPTWLDEAYNQAMSPLDIRLVARPLELAEITREILIRYFDADGRFLDYGGGTGLFTRRMRDLGLDFYRQDKYATNVFAQYFDIQDLPDPEKGFELVTCFEVLEHLPDPWVELDQVFALSKNVLCSTWLQPDDTIETLSNWNYLLTLHGQHVSFYTRRSMEIIADRYGVHYYTNGRHLHVFSEKKLDGDVFDRGDVGAIANAKRLAYGIVNRIFGLIRPRTKALPQRPTHTFTDSAKVTQLVMRDLKGD
ncbi:MAG: class I SAM-dependent methyltransferase [Gammaproteobacteria bacterium]|nr:class I SAM-dependent methyltransferase [Gammaproteobacteria bacterium]MCP5136729.1 class I SAM-dependent methyltransferase [Gammaproteobacteria bacterium]